MVDIRIVSAAEVRRLIDHAEALRLAEAAFAEHGRGRNRLSRPSAQWLQSEHGARPVFKVKGASLGGAGVSGFRVLCEVPTETGERRCNYDLVYDDATAQLIGLVNEVWLSPLRTAATGVVACRLLAPPETRVVTLFGAGEIAGEVVPMLEHAFALEELRIKSRRPESALAFAARHRGRVPFAVRAEPSAERAVQGADVIITLTEANEPLVRRGWLAPGAVLCSMGGRHEVEFGVLDEVDRLVVDDLNYVFDLGDVAAWVSQGMVHRPALEARVDATIGEVACGAKPARGTPVERVLAIIQGMAMGDIAFAAHVLRKAKEAGIGTVVALE